MAWAKLLETSITEKWMVSWSAGNLPHRIKLAQKVGLRPILIFSFQVSFLFPGNWPVWALNLPKSALCKLMAKTSKILEESPALNESLILPRLETESEDQFLQKYSCKNLLQSPIQTFLDLSIHMAFVSTWQSLIESVLITSCNKFLEKLS